MMKMNEATKQETSAEASGSRHDRMVMRPPLAKKHNGMRISASGILQRVGGHLKFGARQMDEHLKEMASRYYAGDVAAVDEFLQLYGLDDNRPAA
jgi:hypothetical protein